MRVKRISLDTNILVYAMDRDAGERHMLAMEVLDQAVESDCILTTQALGEFFHVVTRKNGMPAKDAAQQVSRATLMAPPMVGIMAPLQSA